MEAEQFAELLGHHLSGEELNDGELKSQMLLCSPHLHDKDKFLVWNGEDGDLFMVTVTKCESA